MKSTSLATGVVLTFLSAAVALAAGAGTWTQTGSLVRARALHTATLLPNETVLVAGGTGLDPNTFANVVLSTAEVYNPAKGSWASTGSLTGPRSDHTATLLPDGQVLIVGGTNTLPEGLFTLNTAELYNPATRTWIRTGSLHTTRSGHTATLLPDGKVLVAGGFSFRPGTPLTRLASAEVFDPTTSTWTPAGSMNDARNDYVATLLPTGQVLVAGGFGAGGTVLASAELYDPSTGTWRRTSALATARGGPLATLLATGKVLVAGGGTSFGTAVDTAELFDPRSDRWSATGSPLPPPNELAGPDLSADTANLLPDGLVLAAGSSSARGAPQQPTELYDPSSGSWSLTGDLGTREGHTASLLLDGHVLVAGGRLDRAFAISEADLYTPPTATVLPPTCVLSLMGTDATGHAFIRVAARDIATGLQSVRVLQSTNTSVSLPTFPPSYRDPAVVTATKLDPHLRADLTLQVTTTAGRSLTCDPIIADLIVEQAHPHERLHLFRDVPQSENTVTLTNGSPGLKSVDFVVNAHVYRLAALLDGEQRTLNLSAAMRPGTDNQIRVIDYGPVGASAVLVISN